MINRTQKNILKRQLASGKLDNHCSVYLEVDLLYDKNLLHKNIEQTVSVIYVYLKRCLTNEFHDLWGGEPGPFESVDMINWSGQEKYHLMQDYCSKGFTFGGPFIRCAVLTSDRHYVILSINHAVVDGSGIAFLASAIWESLAKNRAFNLNFADNWQAQCIELYKAYNSSFNSESVKNKANQYKGHLYEPKEKETHRITEKIPNQAKNNQLRLKISKHLLVFLMQELNVEKILCGIMLNNRNSFFDYRFPITRSTIKPVLLSREKIANSNSIAHLFDVDNKPYLVTYEEIKNYIDANPNNCIPITLNYLIVPPRSNIKPIYAPKYYGDICSIRILSEPGKQGVLLDIEGFDHRITKLLIAESKNLICNMNDL